MILTRYFLLALPAVLAVTMGTSSTITTASFASEADDFDLLKQLETDDSGRTTIAGALLDQLQEGTTEAFTGAMGIARLSYDRQMRLEQAKLRLDNCGQCAEEPGLRAEYERQRAEEDRIHDAVSYTLMKSGADPRIAGFLNMLLDPTGIRANEQSMPIRLTHTPARASG